jgi:hypothetical protein
MQPSTISANIALFWAAIPQELIVYAPINSPYNRAIHARNTRTILALHRRAHVNQPWQDSPSTHRLSFVTFVPDSERSAISPLLVSTSATT